MSSWKKLPKFEVNDNSSAFIEKWKQSSWLTYFLNHAKLYVRKLQKAQLHGCAYKNTKKRRYFIYGVMKRKI